MWMIDDDDEVGLKETPEDIRYVKRFNRSYIEMRLEHHKYKQPKCNELDSQLHAIIYWERHTWEWTGTSLPDRLWEEMQSVLRDSAYHRTVGCMDTPVQGLLRGSFIMATLQTPLCRLL